MSNSLTFDKNKVLQADIIEGTNALRIVVGSVYTGYINKINGQNIDVASLTREELVNLLVSTPLDNIDFSTHHILDDKPIKKPKSVPSILSHANSSNFISLNDFSIIYREVPDGILGIKLQLTKNKVLNNHIIKGYEIMSKKYDCFSLSVGDIIVAVNGISLINLLPETAISIISKTKNRRFTILHKDPSNDDSDKIYLLDQSFCDFEQTFSRPKERKVDFEDSKKNQIGNYLDNSRSSLKEAKILNIPSPTTFERYSSPSRNIITDSYDNGNDEDFTQNTISTLNSEPNKDSPSHFNSTEEVSPYPDEDSPYPEEDSPYPDETPVSTAPSSPTNSISTISTLTTLKSISPIRANEDEDQLLDEEPVEDPFNDTIVVNSSEPFQPPFSHIEPSSPLVSSLMSQVKSSININHPHHNKSFVSKTSEFSFTLSDNSSNSANSATQRELAEDPSQIFLRKSPKHSRSFGYREEKKYSISPSSNSSLISPSLSPLFMSTTPIYSPSTTSILGSSFYTPSPRITNTNSLRAAYYSGNRDALKNSINSFTAKYS